ncbi:flagellar biosynthetic protein FliO [Sphingomonas naphthae]|uniref:Flagellar biosynthetic protein FliO n=1 Tax=Sphingomonas naphthae TaxID=1813468 RepID=A0ABY7TI68_9SPHN|nr:flagellar biosynthetic protein FliO [Sphingomonas naphthae]WCT72907.1 flagellar biosynthetic protein FliO [Sphingomonas naphthae]
MIGSYLLNLLLMVPLVGGLAFLSIWLMRKLQPGLAIGKRERAVKVVDAVPLGAMSRLAVVDFAGKRLLVAVSRGRVDLLSEAPAPAEFTLPDEE